MAEAAIAIAYPEPWNRGKALGYWLTYRLGGQILGGAINLGLNVNDSQAGKVSYTVYEVFIALQATGAFVALLLNRPQDVERRDGKKVNLSIIENPWSEIKATTTLFFSTKFLLIVFFIGQAVFSEAVYFTYLSCELAPPLPPIALHANPDISVVFRQVSCPWILPVRNCCRYLGEPAGGKLQLPCPTRVPSY